MKNEINEMDLAIASFRFAMKNPAAINRREALESEKINPKAPLWENSPLRNTSTQKRKLYILQRK